MMKESPAIDQIGALLFYDTLQYGREVFLIHEMLEIIWDVFHRHSVQNMLTNRLYL